MLTPALKGLVGQKELGEVPRKGEGGGKFTNWAQGGT